MKANHTIKTPETSPSSLASAIYTGSVRHRRFTPKYHDFNYKVFMVYLDLHEMDQVFSQTSLWSKNNLSLAWFRRKDFFDGRQDQPLYDSVANKVELETGVRPVGPIRVLTNLRYFGFIINPITCYYCFDASGERVQTVVAEVTNTPWRTRCHYVLDFSTELNDKQQAIFDKTMHVSPFQPMDLYYHWRGKRPADTLFIHLDVFKKMNVQETLYSEKNDGSYQKEVPVFDATLMLQRQEMTASNMRRIILRYPMMTMKVFLGIYWQALVLWCKRIPFFSRVSKIEKHA